MKYKLRSLCAVLFALMLLSSCAQQVAENDGSETAENAITTAIPQTEAEIEATTEETTEAPVTEELIGTVVNEPMTLEVKWNFGYVGSADNAQGYVNRIKPDGGYYSYTDVISIAKKGTKITFIDDNTLAGGDTGFASSAAYVFSSWKETNGKWVIDTDSPCFAGAGAVVSDFSSPVTVNGSKAVKYTYITCKNNENIRICFRSGQTSSFTPKEFPKVNAEPTDELPSYYISAKREAALAEFIAAARANIKYPILKGLKVNFLGDSYFAGDALGKKYTWVSLLGEIYEMNYNNYGANGSPISNFAASGSSMAERYLSMVPNADIVVFEGGKNDFNQNVPIGSNTDTTSKTFKGALNTVIDGLKKRNPDALIICVTPWNVAGTNGIGCSVGDYTKAMLEICGIKGIPCFNASDVSLSGVDMTSIAFRREFCLTENDVSHLNDVGHKNVFPIFEKYVAEAYTKFKQ